MWCRYTDQDIAKAHTFRAMHTSTWTVQNYCVRSADHSLSWHTYWKGNKENYSLDPHFHRWMTYWYSKQFFHVIYSGQEICIVHLSIRYATCFSFFCGQIIDATLWQLTRHQQLFAAGNTLPCGPTWGKYPAIMSGTEIQGYQENSRTNEYLGNTLHVVGKFRSSHLVRLLTPGGTPIWKGRGCSSGILN